MKKSQIIIIIIALVLTLGCAGTFAVLYFATDIFKSEQEMFYKYANQINLKEFIDLQSYNTYLERLKTTGHGEEGEISIEIAQGAEKISESIKYNGYSDPVNKTANYDISINKDNETLLAMNYLNKQDFYGLQFKDVVNQYVVFENNNLKEFASKMGVWDTSEIPNKIEIPESNINYEELNTILNNYLNIAIENIPEENYSKIEKQEIALGDGTIEADGYQAKLKVKDVQNILIKVLENAKNDEQIYNLLNSEDLAFEEYQETVDELLVGISEEIPSEENIEVITISVYKQGKNTVKLAINIALEETENIEISIEKTTKGLMLKMAMIDTSLETREEINITITKTINTEEQENFEIILSQESDQEDEQVLDVKIEPIIINVSRNGALTSNNVQFSTSASTTVREIVFEIQMHNNTNFAGVPKEGDFVQGNHLVINGLAPEQITNLFTNLGSMIGEKLKDEILVSLVTRNMEINNEIIDSAKNQTIQVFNSQFTHYEGTRRGAEIRSIYNVVASSNATNPEHIVVYSGPSQEEIIATKDYNVSTIKDAEGYIYQIIVQEVN